MRVGIIISNHGAEEWTERALREEYGLDEVRYFKHPEIDPRWGKKGVWGLALRFLLDNGILRDRRREGRLGLETMEGLVVAAINGEYGFSTACVHYLGQTGYRTEPMLCVYPTSERGATEEAQPDGSIKTIHIYKFVQFREW